MRLLERLSLGQRIAPNRVMFGPHVTNLGDDERRFSARHVAYYQRRARGGCGTIVAEGASVHPSDWPYERAPLAEVAGAGWSAIADACHAHGALVIASLDHAGGQGSSAYHQLPLWAPSRVPEVASREVPKWMEADDIEAVVGGFAAAAHIAASAGCDGVEINAGQHSLVRQFLSGLTNHRDDRWGTDRLTFAREVIAAVRAGAGPARVVGLRLSCDELAPWAGITPDAGTAIAAALVGDAVDYLVVGRGSIFSVEQTRPDFHQPAGCTLGLASAVAAVVAVPVFAQGSITDADQAERALGGAPGDTTGCAGVEMTRAQIADPDLVAKLRSGAPERVRPCTRCNQTCQVRDVRNPIVTCVGEPTSGRETEDPDWYAPAAPSRSVAVVGAGVAGLETARVAAARGHRVTLYERSPNLGGMAAVAGPNAPIVEWLITEVTAAGVDIRCSVLVDAEELAGAGHPGGAADDGELEGAAAGGGVSVPELLEIHDVIVQCTGGRWGVAEYAVGDGVIESGRLIDIGTFRLGQVAIPEVGNIVLFDPIGGPIAVAFAEELGARAILVTQDHIAGNELSRSGDLAPANTRLAQAGVRIMRRSLLRAVTMKTGGGDGGGLASTDLVVEIADRFSSATTMVSGAAVVDCGFRIPTSPLRGAAIAVGDCVAPRTIHESILEARRAARVL